MLKKENLVFLLFSIAGVSIGLLTTYLLSNYLSIEDFGKLQFLLTLLGISTIFNFSGFNIIMQKQIFNKNDNIVKYILTKVMPFAIVLLFLTSICCYYFLESNNELILYVIIIATFGLFDKSNTILNSKLLFKESRYLDLYAKLLLLILVTLTLFYKYSIEVYLILFTLINSLIFIFRIFYSKKYLNTAIKPGINYAHIKKEGYETTLSVAYAILANWSEKLILGIIDVNLLAIFVIGQLFPRAVKDNIKLILIPTSNMWASHGFEYYKSMINKYELILWGIGFILYIITFLFVDIIINNFFIQYEKSILISQLLAMTLIFNFVVIVKMSSMSLSKHTYIFNKINNISNTLKIVSVLILVNIYGIYGAVASVLILEATRFVLITKEFSKLNKGIK